MLFVNSLKTKILRLVDNDIALVRIAGKAKCGKRIYSACLKEKEPKVGALTTVVGWGKRSYGRKVISSKLRSVNVEVMDTDICNGVGYEGSDGWYGGKVTDNMICGGFEEGDKDACTGDTGGIIFFMF